MKRCGFVFWLLLVVVAGIPGVASSSMYKPFMEEWGSASLNGFDGLLSQQSGIVSAVTQSSGANKGYSGPWKNAGSSSILLKDFTNFTNVGLDMISESGEALHVFDGTWSEGFMATVSFEKLDDGWYASVGEDKVSLGMNPAFDFSAVFRGEATVDYWATDNGNGWWTLNYKLENGSHYSFAVSGLSPVPLPGAVWLLGTSLCALLGFRRVFG